MIKDHALPQISYSASSNIAVFISMRYRSERHRGVQSALTVPLTLEKGYILASKTTFIQ
jgi:hypothetical protein